MKKKIVITLLAFVLSFSGCGEPSQAIKNDDNTEKSVTSTQTEKMENTEIETETEQNINFEEVTVIDNDECVIKITGIDPDDVFGYSLKLDLENKSSDKVYMFSLTNASVNNVQTTPLFASEVAAGKKSIDSICFSDESLYENNIGAFSDIELSFRVYDSNDWAADNVAEETIHIYPYGEDKAVQFTRESQSSDNVIIDNDYATIIVTGYDPDSIWGYAVNLFIINKSDAEIMFRASDASVNGYMADPFFATSVSSGKCSFRSMSWSNSTLEENGISSVEEIEFALRAYDYNDFSREDFINQIITLNP